MKSLLLLLLLLPVLLLADESAITVDLRSPTYRDGVLSTDEGGVIQAEGLRIQAQRIAYTRKTIEGERIIRVEAAGDLMMEYADYVFIGDEMEYDFVASEGVLTNGRSMMGPWYVGGERIRFLPDHSYLIEQAYLTTCENANCEWKLQADCVTIRDGSILLANSVSVRFMQLPIFWLPNFRTNLKDALDIPISYRGQVGGAVGSFVGLRYRFYSWRNWDMFLRLEYFIDRGPGGGLDFHYENEARCAWLESQNYIAHDRSINDPTLRSRYRIAGIYEDHWYNGRYKANARWDKLSDSEMAPDYHLDDFNLVTARRTQLEVLHQQCDTTTNLFTTLRLNSFQSINQELPTIEHSWRPLLLGSSGIISEGRVRLGYHDYVFAKETPLASFDSARLQILQDFYRPFQAGPIRLLPHAGGTLIFYNRSPLNEGQLLLSGSLALDAMTRLSRCYGTFEHILEPYVRYRYWTSPTSTIPEHYLFSIADAWVNLNSFRVGIENQVLSMDSCGGSQNSLLLDLYAYGFIDNHNIPGFIPKIYLNASFTPLPRIDCTLNSAWDFAHNRVDHLNFLLYYTVSEHGAIAAEFRHRSKYSWKKADYLNFVLDTFYPESVLLASGLSDRRDTLLLHAFFRIAPSVTAEIETRHGWDRRAAPSYNEGKIAMVVPLRCRWYLKAAYEHTEYDDQYSVSLTLGKWRRPKVIRELKAQYNSCCQ